MLSRFDGDSVHPSVNVTVCPFAPLITAAVSRSSI